MKKMIEYDAVVTRVVDGDTFEATVTYQVFDMVVSVSGLMFRVAALSAPELREEKGFLSKNAANFYLLNENVKLLYVGAKSFDRYVVEVLVDGKNFTTLMVENGYGEYYEYKRGGK